MDGEPAIIDAEVGNGIADDEFYVDLTFSEGVYGATGRSGAVAASALNIFRVDRAEFTNAAPTVSTAGTTFSPTRVTQPGGAALAGGESVIRAHFASSNHPNVLHTASTVATLIAIRPAGTEAIYDADDNQIHGGSDDWYMQVLHDRLAPYISAAEVGPASQYINLTFSEAVKFERGIAASTLAPVPEDFEIVHYDASGSTVRYLVPAAVPAANYAGTLADGLTGLRLTLPAGEYASDDTVDVRIAERVKEPTFPSLASVFTADTNSKKYDSDFPRTAAPAQVGSLPLRGRDVYTVKFTGSDTGSGRDITAITFDPSGTVASPLTVPERNTGQDTGIGILVERTETADEGRITLQIARTAGTNNDGVSIRVGGASGDVTIPANGNVNLVLVIEAGQSSQQITAKVEGNDDGATGNRIYTFTLDGNDQTQDFTAPAIQLTIEDDDDEAAVLAKGASPESAVGQTEAGLQTGSVRIDSGATVTEGDDVDGVARMIIDVDILRANGSSEDVSSPGDYLSTQGRSPILESVSINYSVATVSNDLVVTLNGSAQETLDRAEDLVQALNFFLPADDRDIGNSATVSISLVPPSSAGNTTRSTQTYTINITPNDAPELLPDGEEPLEVTLAESDSFIVQTTVTSGGGGTEGGQVRIRPTGIAFQRYDSAGPEVSGFGHVESLSYVSGVGIPVALLAANGTPMERRLDSNSPVRITLFPTQALREEFNGIATLTIALTDDQGETASREIKWTVDAVNDPLDFSIDGCKSGDLGADSDCSLSVEVGEAETFIADVADPDVDAVDLGSSVTLAGNSGNYFRAGDTMTVMFSVPADEADNDDIKGAIVRDSMIAFMNGVTPPGVSGAIQRTADLGAGTVSFMLTFADATAAVARTIFETLEISVADPGANPVPPPYIGARYVTVSAATSANDGRLGNEPADDLNNSIRAPSVRTFILEGSCLLDPADVDADDDCVPDRVESDNDGMLRVADPENPTDPDLMSPPIEVEVVGNLKLRLGSFALDAARERFDEDGEEIYSANIPPSAVLNSILEDDNGGLVSTETGVYDYEVVDLGQTTAVTVLIPLLQAAQSPDLQVRKYFESEETWNLFVVDDVDRVYFSTAEPCPGVDATREETLGDGGIWRLARSADGNEIGNIVQDGATCLLLVILDNGPNDADPSVGTIAGPVALATIPFRPTLTANPTSFILSNTADTEKITITASGFALEDERSVRIILKRSEDIILDNSWFDVSRSRTTFAVTVKLVSVGDLIDPHDDLPYADTDLPLTFELPAVEFKLDEEGRLVEFDRSRIISPTEASIFCRPGQRRICPFPPPPPGGGGGGTMEPIWLLLLALAMALPYGLRRRQSSPFIS